MSEMALDTRTSTRDEILRDSAALIRLLGSASHAHMLDEPERLDHLLSQITPSACERIAAELGRLDRDTSAPFMDGRDVDDFDTADPLAHLSNVVDLRSRP